MGVERRLLILACSQRKRPDAGLLPALERYDGPPFRVLRRFGRADPERLPQTWVLSAEFGLVGAAELLPWYDRRMTPERAAELRPAVLARLEALLGQERFTAALVSVGRTYLHALHGFEALLPPGLALARTAGGSGRRLSQLRAWLENSSLDAEPARWPAAGTGGEPSAGPEAPPP